MHLDADAMEAPAPPMHCCSFPAVEKRARQRRGPLALRAMLALDVVLEPAQRGLFRVVSVIDGRLSVCCRPCRMLLRVSSACRGATRSCALQSKADEDCNYAAMAATAVMSIVLEILFGSPGLLSQAVPDPEVLRGLNYLIFFQQMLLLPQWAMAVFRYFCLI